MLQNYFFSFEIVFLCGSEDFCHFKFKVPSPMSTSLAKNWLALSFYLAKIYISVFDSFFLYSRNCSSLKVPKREIFDLSDFPDFYRIRSSWVGDLVVKILT